MSLSFLVLSGFLAAAAPVALDGLSSVPPADWKESPSASSMRLKQFSVPKTAGDTFDAELVIFYFGAGQGGGIEANLDRWKKMFEAPAGKPIASKVDKLKVGKVPVTILDVSGTYLYKASPMAPTPAEPRAGHRMLAVVFESPQGPYFFRLVGPEKTVTKQKPAFEKWIKSFK